MKRQPAPEPLALIGEPMISAREASQALALPYFWFSDRKERTRYRIPHYRLVGLIRFRPSELTVWLQSACVQRKQRRDTNGEGPA